MQKQKYKLYLASGIRLWSLFFKDKYAPFFNKKVDLFQPALIDSQYTGNHRLIPIRIATKDLGEINKCDAVLAYMKMYDTQNNGPAGTDSTWECGYAIGNEKPTIMLVENLEHLDYYSAQWMVTFSIGAILTTSKEVADYALNNEKFTHTTILHCSSEKEFENKIIQYLDNYYKSIYAREGVINYEVDKELREYGKKETILQILNDCNDSSSAKVGVPASLEQEFEEIFNNRRKFNLVDDYKEICILEQKKAAIIERIIENDSDSLALFLRSYIGLCLKKFGGKQSVNTAAEMISYWLAIPSQKITGRKQGKKKTRPAIFYELYDLVSHHIVSSQKYFDGNFVYKMGAIIEVYNWLNTYAIDDVFDNSETRQGELTLHNKFKSRKNALLIGSIGHCLSLLFLLDLTKTNQKIGKKLVGILNEVQNIMYKGQSIDIDLSFTSSSEALKFVEKSSFTSALKLYFRRIYGICGSFYENIGTLSMDSTNVGAQFYDPDEISKACIYIAKLFGLVQMIRNDLGDYILPELMAGMSKGMKNSSHNDLAEGKLTLPLLYAIYHTTKEDRAFLIKCIGNKKLKRKDKIEICRIIWESGAIEYSMQFIDRYTHLVSEQYIKHIHETPTRLKWILKLMDITPLINLSFRKFAVQKKWKKLEPQPLENEFFDQIQKITEKSHFVK